MTGQDKMSKRGKKKKTLIWLEEDTNNRRANVGIVATFVPIPDFEHELTTKVSIV